MVKKGPKKPATSTKVSDKIMAPKDNDTTTISKIKAASPTSEEDDSIDLKNLRTWIKFGFFPIWYEKRIQW